MQRHGIQKMPTSKSRIDKSGRALTNSDFDLTEEYLELDEIFDQFRESHLAPLTSLTASIQNVLSDLGESYYIAQRLKRKPQIVRKLKRLSVRLTQLQDIGGLRIIVNDNSVIQRLEATIENSIAKNPNYTLARNADYRPEGRDDSGYRALHKIVKFQDIFLEVQIRSRAQHYWAESVERTSVFYGKRLKEGEGSSEVLLYFKNLSNVFASIERGYKQSAESISVLNKLSSKSEEIIRRDGFAHLMDGRVNQDVIKTMIQKERSNPGKLNNWILVFDWKTANFVTWDIVGREPNEAVAQYVRYEREFPETESFEVVLIGSSDVSTVQKTHSHYFGISSPDKLIEDLGQSIINITDNTTINAGAKRILYAMSKRKIWGESQGVQMSTLRNHFCRDVEKFEDCLELLIERGFILNKGGAGLTLEISKTNEIEALV